jgi:cytochrome c oxidase assembly factor CtaG
VLATAADTSWTFEPGAIAALAIVSVVYVRRWRTARAEGGPRAAGGRHLAAFIAAMLTIVVAIISPIDRLAEQLFAMHMIQHVLLLDVAAILLLLSLTKHILRPVTRRLQTVEEAAGPLATPAFAVAVYVIVMWVWHLPSLYDAALRHPYVHVVEHLCFAGAGLLYWWHLLSPIRTRQFRGLQPVIYMASTKVLVGMLGIGLTFAPNALYAFYEHQPRIWGLSATDDQAVAGAIMAIEQSVVMGIALAWLFVRALGESEQDEQRAERYGAA